jgi:hypothetical protein
MRMPTWSIVSLRAMALALALPGIAAAQGLQPVLMVAECPVFPGKEAAFLQATARFGPAFEKLMASGDVLSWGVGSAMLHRPGVAGFYPWYTARDMGAVERIENALDALGAGDERAAKAARAAGKPAPKGLFETWLSTFDVAKHRDVLYREEIVEFGKAAPAGAKPYLWVTWVRALPGKARDVKAAWEKYRKPVYARLVAEGAIGGYGFATEELKSTDEFTHMIWLSLPDLGAREKVRDALDAIPEAEKNAAQQAFLAAIDPSASRSTVLKSEMFAAAPAR